MAICDRGQNNLCGCLRKEGGKPLGKALNALPRDAAGTWRGSQRVCGEVIILIT